MKSLIPVAAAFFLSSQVAAQTPEEMELQRETEARRAEIRVQQAEARERMIEAERQLAEAARRVAELSSQSLPRRGPGVERFEFDFGDKPRLGVTIGGNSDEGPVEGVVIMGITPGSAAEDAGLRAGDIITSINSESLSADNTAEAQEQLLDFMDGIEEGDALDVEYLRDGDVGKVTVKPRVVEGGAYAFVGGVPGFPVPEVHVAPEVAREFKFVMPFVGNSWGDMELVELNAGLGRYFGTDTGLLVINAPKAEAFKLEDGDVIESIDGREPTSVGHALRILGSYQAGEQLELKIMRDKRRQTLNIEMPDDRTSFVVPPEPPAARAPVRVVVPAKPVREERT
jgi:S1-C subfamily serine protease